MAGTRDLRVCAVSRALPGEDVEWIRKHPAVLPGSPVFDTPAELLSAMHPEVLLVSTRIDRIGPVAIEGARAGCHLVCEKPLALNVALLDDLWQAAVANHVQCIAMMGNRAHPAIRAARQAVDAGLMGKVVLANARKSYKWGQRPEWFGNPALYGGTIPWIGIHALDFIISGTGQRLASVAAMQSNLAHPGHPGCEDNAVLMLEMSGGGHATTSIDYHRPAAASTHGDDWLRVVGSDGVIEASLARCECSLITHDERARQIALPPQEPFYLPFLRGLAGHSAGPCPDMLDAFHLTRAALTAREAARQGIVLPIPPPP
jgi:predicted dehydrogenase